jgi:hypothetical protein
MVIFELLVRYLAKDDNQRLGLPDYFIAVPLLGSGITALPGLIALRAEGSPGEGELAAAGFALIFLAFCACWLVVFNKRTMERHRTTGGGWRRVFWVTLLPNAIAAACLGLVFAYAP